MEINFFEYFLIVLTDLTAQAGGNIMDMEKIDEKSGKQNIFCKIIFYTVNICTLGTGHYLWRGGGGGGGGEEKMGG